MFRQFWTKIALGIITPSIITLGISYPALGAGDAQHVNGADLGLIWAFPFIGQLLSIAVLPIAAPKFWHAHFGKLSMFWALCVVVPLLGSFGVSATMTELVHVAFLEYFPFVILLLSLFTVAGGICLRGTLLGNPSTNTGMLAFGTLIASWTGTTGAAMLLIRPLLSANETRKFKIHTIVFFIFLVANIGGSLTPLGDPPLFLGFLKGVDFFWTTTHLLVPMIFVSALLLAMYYCIDKFYYYRKEDVQPPVEKLPLKVEGRRNFILLAGIIAAVLISGSWNPGISFFVAGVELPLQMIARDVFLVLITMASMLITPKRFRDHNHFHWFPMIEVAKLFAGIFITIIPVIAILKVGVDGDFAPLVNLVRDGDGNPNNMAYFWITGILSSFLDNAPTYLVFFNMAGGDAVQLMGPLANTLLAISMAAVFMGALTYIGNAPNFLVRSIAEDQGIAMPSFFGYIGWSAVILLPIFLLVSLIYF